MRPESGRLMTVEEYLRFEETSPLKHEYVAGEVYAMAGATRRHDRIALNVGTRLFTAAGDGPCHVMSSDVRLQAAGRIFYYPDATVACGPFDDGDVVVQNPCVVAEVTSPATARVDRSEKLLAYQAIDSLRAYLIVDHRRRRVEWYSRADAASPWIREDIAGEGAVRVPCVETTLTLDMIYAGVDVPAVGEPYPVEYEI